MNRRNFLLVAFLVSIFMGTLWISKYGIARMNLATVGGSAVTAAGGPSQKIYDAFTRANSDTFGGDWTEQTGDWDISSNQAVVGVATTHSIASNSVSIGSIEQYALFTWVGGLTSSNWNSASIVFRVTDNASHAYHVQLHEETGTLDLYAEWNHINKLTTGLSFTAIGASKSVDITPLDGDKFGFTITGTGTDTVVRIWHNPTGTVPDSASSWGGDTTPTFTFEDNPGTNNVDTGNYIALHGYNSAGTIILDDFYAGSL